MIDWLLPLVPILPFAPLALYARRGMHRLVPPLVPWTALPALALAVAPAPGMQVELPWLLLGMRLGVDATARPFLLFTALLWSIAAWFARHYLAGDPRRHAFTAFFCTTLAGNLGLILAQDIASFYFFFALMTFAAYGLVVHDRTAEARRAGRIYIILAVLGEAALLAGLLLAADAAGGLDLAPIPRAVADAPHGTVIAALLLAGFGVKAGVVLLHVWLALAHPVAPTPASAVLSGAMIKAGLLGWLRFLPLGEAALPGWGALVVTAGLAAAFYGVAVGLAQRDAKTVLAYSSVSQMGFMTIGVGAGLMAPAAWPALLPAVTLYALHHAFAKGTLFLGVGAARAAGGALRRWMLPGLLLPALALAGAPFTSGALAKFLLKDALAALPAPWPAWLAALLPLAAVGTTALMAWFLFVVRREMQQVREAHTGLGTPWLVSLAVTSSLAWFIVDAEAAWSWRDPGALWSAAWPLLAGAAMVAAATALARAGRRIPAVPPGDVLVPLEHGWRRLARTTSASAAARQASRFVARLAPALPRPAVSAAARLEPRLRSWRFAGAALLAGAIALFLLLILG